MLRSSSTTPSRFPTVGLLEAAAAAARAIPPAFPLSATVAVNPFLGQTGEPLATASARLGRVAGVRLTLPRAERAAGLAAGEITRDDLAAALDACPFPGRPADVDALLAAPDPADEAPRALPTVADLAAEASGTDWPAVIARSFGLWAAGHFDRGQALWSPAPGRTAYAAWREWAVHDLTPEIAGLAGFCSHVARAPDTPERAILDACERLGVTAEAAPTVFHRLLADLGGWAQHARWQSWQAELDGGSDGTLVDLLAVRLVWEDALLARFGSVADAFARTVAAHAAPVVPTAGEIVDAIWQEAAERAHQRRLAGLLAGPRGARARSALTAAFCIDVRSEVFRRALESVDASISTLGFAGFFGLPIGHRPHGTDETDAHVPVLLTPGLFTCSHAEPPAEQAARIGARAKRAYGRFRQAAVSSFAFVEAAGPAYAWTLVRDALGLGPAAPAPGPAPRIAGDLSAEAKAATAASVLRAMGLVRVDARLVLLVGHGARVANNPYESAYHCGACGGRTGEVSARVLARLLNDPETRAGLAAHGVEVAADTAFVAGLHETTTDEVVLHVDDPLPGHEADVARARAFLARAGAIARAERARRLPGARPDTVAARAADWAEVRPEWGLAGCAAFVAAPRAATAGVDLGGRAFLNEYDWRTDKDFATLELILTAPVVVASWIGLQYYGSTVAPDAFGSGDKLVHNVVGGIGVVEGNGGRLRAGLPLQAVHDGERPVHDPLRLTVLVEAPREAIAAVLGRHPGVRELFDNGWLHLLALEEGRVAARYRPGLAWEEAGVSDSRRAAA